MQLWCTLVGASVMQLLQRDRQQRMLVDLLQRRHRQHRMQSRMLMPGIVASTQGMQLGWPSRTRWQTTQQPLGQPQWLEEAHQPRQQRRQQRRQGRLVPARLMHRRRRGWLQALQ